MMRAIFLLAVILASFLAWAYVPIQTGPTTCNAISGTVTCTMGSSVPSGSIMVIGGGVRTTVATGITSVTDNLSTPTVYTQRISSAATTGWVTAGTGAIIFTGKTTVSGTPTVSMVVNNTYNFGWIVMAAYDGSQVTETVDATTSGASPSGVTSMPCTAFTPSANTQIVSVIYDNAQNTTAVTAKGSMTNRIVGLDISGSGTRRKTIFQDYFTATSTSITTGIDDAGGAAAYSCAALSLTSVSSPRIVRRVIQ